MKILFINKYDKAGGAAIASWRLHRQLEKTRQVEDVFLVGIKKSSEPYVHVTRKPGIENNLERGVNFVFNRLGLQYVWFPFSTRRIRKFTADFKPDVIALQNIHGGYFKTELVAELSRLAPVVWTLHDMWAFTANAAYTFTDESWKHMRGGVKEREYFPSTGLRTGRWLLGRKKKIYARGRLTVVCPSRWLQGLARQSPVFGGKEIFYIPNGIDTSFYRPLTDKTAVRRELGIAPNAKVVLLSAEKLLQSDYKGGADLQKVLQWLDHESTIPVTLLTLGHDPLPVAYQYLQVKSMGYIAAEEQVRQALQASDIYLHTARADNLPNTLVEAISCGIPCVTFDIGGCGEIVKDGENGCLVPPFDHAGFAGEVLSLLQDPVRHQLFSINARRIAEENFDVRIMADRYFELFQALI